MAMRLQDKIVLLTSAENPCARAIATRFAREGAHCAIVDQERAQAEQLAADIRAIGRRALALPLDVAKKSDVEEAVRRTVAEFGRIDVLVNGSLVSRHSDFLNLSENAFNEAIERGPKAYFLTAQSVGRQMAEQRSGKIINLSTVDARLGSGESAANSAACSSIDSMTRAIAQALGFYGVNVNALVCGPLDSSSLTDEEAAERLRRIPLGRSARAEDLLGAALFLATDDSNFVCGESLYVDAGYSNAAVTEDGFRPAWARTWGRFAIPPRSL
jgi:3-oxoacyl-[acyl-carrier protein] reductase